MNKTNMWVTVLASAGIGAAAYYNLSKSDKPLDKAFETVAPMFSSTSGQNSGQNEANQYTEKQTLGPHGMS